MPLHEAVRWAASGQRSPTVTAPVIAPTPRPRSNHPLYLCAREHVLHASDTHTDVWRPAPHPSSPAGAGTQRRLPLAKNTRDIPPFINQNTRSNINVSRVDTRRPCQPTPSECNGGQLRPASRCPHLVLKPVTTEKGRVRFGRKAAGETWIPTPPAAQPIGEGNDLNMPST